MKKVKKQMAFCNGSKSYIDYIDLFSVYDNLKNIAEFRYVLLTEDKVQVGEGSEVFENEEYLAWDASRSMAYNMVIKRLDLELEPSLATSEE